MENTRNENQSEIDYSAIEKMGRSIESHTYTHLEFEQKKLFQSWKKRRSW